jgi:hypothetical protein
MTGDFLRAPLIPHSETSLEDARPIFGPLPVSDKEFIVVISRFIHLCLPVALPPSHARAFSLTFFHEHEHVQTLAIISGCTYRPSCSCITAKHASFSCARLQTQADVPQTRARVIHSHARIQGNMDFNSMPTWTDSLVQYLKEVLLPFVHACSVRSDM